MAVQPNGKNVHMLQELGHCTVRRVCTWGTGRQAYNRATVRQCTTTATSTPASSRTASRLDRLFSKKYICLVGIDRICNLFLYPGGYQYMARYPAYRISRRIRPKTKDIQICDLSHTRSKRRYIFLVIFLKM